MDHGGSWGSVDHGKQREARYRGSMRHASSANALNHIKKIEVDTNKSNAMTVYLTCEQNATHVLDLWDPFWQATWHNLMQGNGPDIFPVGMTSKIPNLQITNFLTTTAFKVGYRGTSTAGFMSLSLATAGGFNLALFMAQCPSNGAGALKTRKNMKSNNRIRIL